MRKGEETGGNCVSRKETAILSIIEPYPRPLIAANSNKSQKINSRLPPPGLVAHCSCSVSLECRPAAPVRCCMHFPLCSGRSNTSSLTADWSASLPVLESACFSSCQCSPAGSLSASCAASSFASQCAVTVYPFVHGFPKPLVCCVAQQHRWYFVAQQRHGCSVVQQPLLSRVQGNLLPRLFGTSSVDLHGSSQMLIALILLPSSLGAHCGSALSSLSLPWFTLGWSHQCRLPAVSHGMSQGGVCDGCESCMALLFHDSVLSCGALQFHLGVALQLPSLPSVSSTLGVAL